MESQNKNNTLGTTKLIYLIILLLIVGMVVLIAGGQNKGLDLEPLAALAPALRGVVAIGAAAPEIRAVFAGGPSVRTASDMAAAVREATAMAQEGDAVLLSPGCASFDWYGSYGERGDDFAGQVRKLLGEDR